MIKYCYAYKGKSKRTTAVPEKGKANKKVIEIISKYLKIPKSRIRILKGETSKEKLIKIDD